MWYALGIILLVGLIGEFFINHEIAASTYNNNIKNGRTEINNKQYNEAQADFQKAAKIKPDSMEANNLLSQTSKFVDGENKFKDYDFGESSSDFNDVLKSDQGSSVLKNRAKVELKVLKQVSENFDRLEKIYNQALEQNKAKEFTASNNTLDGIFDDDLASNSFYAGIVNEAKKLKSANDNQVILSKFKAKKHSSTSNKKKKKTKKITKASKETSSAIDAVNNSVAPSVTNNDTTTSNDNSSYNSSKESTDSQFSSNTSASDNTTSNSAPTNNSSNSQLDDSIPAEKHDSGSNNNDRGSTPASKPDDGGSSSHNNEPATPPAGNQGGNVPTTGTPSN